MVDISFNLYQLYIHILSCIVPHGNPCHGKTKLPFLFKNSGWKLWPLVVLTNQSILSSSLDNGKQRIYKTTKFPLSIIIKVLNKLKIRFRILAVSPLASRGFAPRSNLKNNYVLLVLPVVLWELLSVNKTKKGGNFFVFLGGFWGCPTPQKIA